MIGTMSYTACVRQEAGMCGINWRESSTTSPDAFTLDDTLTKAAGVRINYSLN